MSIYVKCDNCTKTFKVKDQYAGQEGACPYCGGRIIVPDPRPEMSGSAGSADIVYQEKTASGTSTSSLSLVTKIPRAPCPSCGQPNLIGNPSCFHCGVSLLG